ncbi:probable gluconokinase [Sycon ciliatum]|uniref:probable gluconokinase n=1 Tax=Sycon ciliatum TaxID=27933 RepID=UPI0020AB006A|eukprot:scpid97937/ scgid10694/ Probable gluconokinase; Gluconate kinase
MILILMGVCGCGKSSVGQALAKDLECSFVDADDLHPETNKDKMSRGVPLTDDDRLPWLRAVNREMNRLHTPGSSVVVACSALKASYRHILVSNLDQDDSHTRSHSGVQQDSETISVSSDICFVHLDGSFELIASRMSTRHDHFMPTSLLQSQFAALERPTHPERFITVDVSPGVDETVRSIRSQLRALAHAQAVL